MPDEFNTRHEARRTIAVAAWIFLQRTPLRRGLTSVATRKPRNHAVRTFALNPLTPRVSAWLPRDENLRSEHNSRFNSFNPLYISIRSMYGTREYGKTTSKLEMINGKVCICLSCSFVREDEDEDLKSRNLRNCKRI